MDSVMARTIDFFYGIGSRYSYLAASRMEALARDTGATVRWRPLYSRLLMERRGMDPFQGPPASGQYEPAYRTRDVARWASCYGIPFHDPDWEALDWHRFALAAVAADRLGGVVPFTTALFDAVFGAGVAPKTAPASSLGASCSGATTAWCCCATTWARRHEASRFRHRNVSEGVYSWTQIIHDSAKLVIKISQADSQSRG
jgi:2-hydroxychromene-2-carboxylate isomerase